MCLEANIYRVGRQVSNELHRSASILRWTVRLLCVLENFLNFHHSKRAFFVSSRTCLKAYALRFADKHRSCPGTRVCDSRRLPGDSIIANCIMAIINTICALSERNLGAASLSMEGIRTPFERFLFFRLVLLRCFFVKIERLVSSWEPSSTGSV